MFGPELIRAFQEFKGLWDPDNRMNPGKVVHPRGMMEDLRQPPPPATETHFSYPENHGGFSRAIALCVGVGRCRKEEGGLMCPSYQITRNEADSTRGRAHLLDEMLRAETIPDGWKSEAVKEALDLCLACKGCKSECPTNIDMASYKAEFLSHYYEGRLRPRQAYVFGLVMYWLRIGAWAPRLVNFFTQTPGLSGVLKKFLGGIAPTRTIPPLAVKTFKQHYELDPGFRRDDRQTPLSCCGPTHFTNHLHPEIGQAATEVLRHLGYDVRLPAPGLCCGRPLYDYGFLPLAKRMLRQILDALRADIEAGTPLIGLEPSCVAVFRDELCNLFPNDPLAQKLKNQTFLLSEFLLQNQKWIPATNRGNDDEGASSPVGSDGGPIIAVLQTHCHQKSVLSATSERDLLKTTGAIRCASRNLAAAAWPDRSGLNRIIKDCPRRWVSARCCRRSARPTQRPQSSQTVFRVRSRFARERKNDRSTSRRFCATG